MMAICMLLQVLLGLFLTVRPLHGHGNLTVHTHYRAQQYYLCMYACGTHKSTVTHQYLQFRAVAGVHEMTENPEHVGSLT